MGQIKDSSHFWLGIGLFLALFKLLADTVDNLEGRYFNEITIDNESNFFLERFWQGVYNSIFKMKWRADEKLIKSLGFG